MDGSVLEIATGDGVADCFLAMPDDEPRAAVLFMIDGYGLRERTETMAGWIAERGYAVLVPNVFYRAGRAPVAPVPDFDDPASKERFWGRILPLAGELTAEAMAADGAAYLDALAERVPGRVGVTGYCMGGRLGWRIAAAHPDRVASLACFHAGGLVSDGDDSPHRSADRLRSELYFGFADQDSSMTAEQIAELKRALDAAGADYRAEVYSGAQHGYTMFDTPAFDEPACDRAFEELFALLDRTLPS